MSITLSAADLRRLESTMRHLARPLDAPDADVWRARVIAEVRTLLRADTAGFHLPVERGVEFYSDDFSQNELESRPYIPPPPLPDGTCMVKHGIHLGVSTLEGAYGRHGDLYLTSDYYNEYARPLGKDETLFASVGWGDLTPDSAGSIQFHRQKPGGDRFGDREMTILRLLYPALTAGVDAWRRWDRWREDLLRVLDSTGQAAMVFSPDGRLLHRTPAITKLLAVEPQGEVLLVRMREAALALTSPPDGILLPPPPAGEVVTATARYAIRVSTYQGGASTPLAIAAVDRLTRVPRSPEELRRVYGLTPAEVGVATLLAAGRSNAELAGELVISPHTARRHTERVLRKLGVRSRAEVAARVLA
jgi:DNA-binding CsgD family transcriptional regulator